MNGRKIFKEISTNGYDAALFLDETSCYYLSDFFTTDGCVVVSEKETALITDSRYIEAAEKNKAEGNLSDDVTPILFKSPLFQTINDYFKEHHIKKVCLDPKLVTLAQSEMLKDACPDVKFGTMADVVLKYRRVKSASEVEKIKKAQSITDSAFSHIVKFIQKGKKEIEVAAELEYFMRSHGASGMAFDTIAVSGKKSSCPHGVPNEDYLTENSFFTMDFGAKYAGYCSDMTRTVVLGRATDEMKDVYYTVLKAQMEAMKFIKPNVTGVEADKVARDVITEAGYGEYFTHSLGHSVGIEIHELPSLSTRSKDTLVEGNIVTVEPGIYIPGKFGVRIENMVLVTDDGCECLTNSCRELFEI